MDQVGAAKESFDFEGKTVIPDGVNEQTVYEVKYTRYQAFTQHGLATYWTEAYTNAKISEGFLGMRVSVHARPIHGTP